MAHYVENHNYHQAGDGVPFTPSLFILLGPDPPPFKTGNQTDKREVTI